MWITIAQEDGGMPGQPEDPRRVGSEPSGRVLSAIALDLHGPPGGELSRVLGHEQHRARAFISRILTMISIFSQNT